MSSITAPPTVSSPEPHGRHERGGVTSSIGVPASGPPVKPRRDPVIDAVRTVSMFVVVALHALLVGAWRTADGGLGTQVALIDPRWFPAFTWCFQVMPLFFIAGGFAAAAQWRRMRGAGATAGDYIRGRVRRLAVPAAVMITVVGGVLAIARALAPDAASAALLHEAAYRIGQPLWFLAVYAGATALVPVMMALHERFRWAVPAALLVAALAVDMARGASDLQAIGYANLAFVWLFNQQLGFCLADAGMGARRSGLPWAAPSATRLRNRPRPRRSGDPATGTGPARSAAGLVAALAAIAFLGGHGWSLDLLACLNPPTAVLALLGVTQLYALRLAYPLLHALATRPAIARVVRKAGACAITVYLWHMPIVLALVAALWAVGAPLPDVHSPAWWATRGFWLVGVASCVIPVGLALSPAERWAPRVPEALLPRKTRPPRPWPAGRVTVPIAVAAPVLAIARVATAQLGGLSGLPGSIGAALLLWTALAVSSGRAAWISPRARSPRALPSSAPAP